MADVKEKLSVIHVQSRVRDSMHISVHGMLFTGRCTCIPLDEQVKDGRWAYTEIPRMKLNNPGNINADVYSKLRAPWTLNDRP